MARRVEALLGRAVFVSAAEAELSVEVQLQRDRTKDAGAYRARMAASDAAGAVLGERHMRDDDCVQLAEQLILAIALTLNPEGAYVSLPASLALDPDTDPAEALRSETSSAANRPSDAPVNEAAPAVVEPDAARGRKSAAVEPNKAAEPEGPWLDLVVLGQASTGLQPNPGFGPALSLMLPSVGLRLSTSYWAPQTWDVGAGRVSLWLAQTGLSLCPELGRALGARTRLCGGLDVGFVQLSALGFPRGGVTREVTASARAGGRLRWSLPAGLSVVVELELGLPFVRRRFTYITESGQPALVHRLDAVVGQLGLGLGYTF